MTSVTIRELGGEMWAELSDLVQVSKAQGDNTFMGYNFEALNKTIDLAMAVVARHVGETIVNDGDIPVIPLPKGLERDQ